MSLFKSNWLEIQDYELEWDLAKDHEYTTLLDDFFHNRRRNQGGIRWISSSKNDHYCRCKLRIFFNYDYYYRSDDYLNVELEFPSLSENKTIYYNIGIKRADENNSFNSKKKGKVNSSTFTLTNFIKLNDLKNFKQTGAIPLICCFITEINLQNAPSKSPTYVIKDEAIGQRVLENYELLKETLHPNVSLNIGGDVLKVHKCILCSNSPVFAKMFEHDMKEKRTNSIDINNFQKETIDSLIHFIYYDKPKEILLNSVCELCEAAKFYQIDDLEEICIDYMKKKLSHATVIELYNGALLHQITEILNLCLEFMKNNLNEDSVCKVLRLALKNDEKELKSSAISYICRHGKTIFKKLEWKNFAKDNMKVAYQILQAYVET